MFKVCNKDIRARSIGISSGVFIVNFKHVQPINIVFLLITLNMCLFAGTSYAKAYSKPYETSLMELSAKTVNSLKYFCKEIYFTCSTGFSIHLCSTKRFHCICNYINASFLKIFIHNHGWHNVIGGWHAENWYWFLQT